MSIEDDIDLLARVPTFSVLGHEALRVLAIGADSRTLREGEVLCREGEPSDAGFVVEEGVLTAQPRNPELPPILMPRGTLVGELSLLIEMPRPATVTAREPSSVMRIARPLFLKMLQGYPEVAERLRRTLVERTQQMTSELGAVGVVFNLGAAPRGSLPAPSLAGSSQDGEETES